MLSDACVRPAASLDYADIVEGAVYSFTRQITAADGAAFARLSGDYNPLHHDAEFARARSFPGAIAHGLLAGSLCSTLVGMHCPGENSLYLKQTLHFRGPIFYGDTVEVRGTVTRKHDSVRVVTIRTEILREDVVLVTGEAQVKVIGARP